MVGVDAGEHAAALAAVTAAPSSTTLAALVLSEGRRGAEDGDGQSRRGDE